MTQARYVIDRKDISGYFGRVVNAAGTAPGACGQSSKIHWRIV